MNADPGEPDLQLVTGEVNSEMSASAALRVVPLLLFPSVLGFCRQAPANSARSDPSQETLFVPCQKKDTSKHVLSPISLSDDEKWRAYVEVDVPNELECLHTTRLWVARSNAPYRLVYLMPPKPVAAGNGMEILGWSQRSSMLLVRTEEWQEGSDALDAQDVLAIDAGSGMVYQPQLDAILDARREKQCFFRVMDAGFGSGNSVKILVRAKLFTLLDVDETEESVPPAKRCGNAEETWSFDFGSGVGRQVTNTQPLQIVKKQLPARRNKN